MVDLPAIPVTPEERLASLEQIVESLRVNVHQLKLDSRDHAERFDTLQTPWWKRLAFWIDGWPWYDLNGTQRRRPWHRGH